MQETSPKLDLIGNGECNIENQNKECHYDAGDCCNQTLVSNNHCEKINFYKTCGMYDGGDCLCPKPDLVGNSHCNNDYKDYLKLVYIFMKHNILLNKIYTEIMV